MGCLNAGGTLAPCWVIVKRPNIAKGNHMRRCVCEGQHVVSTRRKAVENWLIRWWRAVAPEVAHQARHSQVQTCTSFIRRSTGYRFLISFRHQPTVYQQWLFSNCVRSGVLARSLCCRKQFRLVAGVMKHFAPKNMGWEELVCATQICGCKKGRPLNFRHYLPSLCATARTITSCFMVLMGSASACFLLQVFYSQ